MQADWAARVKARWSPRAGREHAGRKETGLPEENKCELEDDGNENCERLG